MKFLSTSLAVAGLAVALSGCVYYPNGPYGPGYGPYRPGYDQPPPGGPGPGDGPPPPQGDYGPPPPQQQGYAPQGQYAQPPGQAPAEMQAGSGPNEKQLAKMNDPTWCNSHPKKCEKLRSQYGQPQGSYDQGPPPNQGPPPGQQ